MKARSTGLIDTVLDLAKEALGVTELQAKLDACSDACKLSEDAEPLKPGDSAWSHAYEDVADLRRDWLREVGISNQQSAEMTRLGCELARANNEVGRLSKCSAEHEKKSNDRRLELVAIAQALGCPVVKEKMLERIAELKGDNRAGSFARSVNADPSAPMTATVKGDAVSLQPVAAGPTKPTWSDWVLEPCLEASHGSMRPVWVHTRRRRGDGLIMQAGPAGWVASSRHRGDAKDIDDAREKADAHLVGIGELEAESAFERLGDWDEFVDGMWVRPSTRNAIRVNRVGGWEVFAVLGGRPVLIAAGQETCDAGKEAVDALLAQHGWLDPSRAFNAQRAEELAPLSDEEIVARHGKHSLAVPFVGLGKGSAK